MVLPFSERSLLAVGSVGDPKPALGCGDSLRRNKPLTAAFEHVVCPPTRTLRGAGADPACELHTLRLMAKIRVTLDAVVKINIRGEPALAISIASKRHRPTPRQPHIIQSFTRLVIPTM